MITEKTDSQTIKNHAVSKGMKTLRTDGLEKALKGITTVEEVLKSNAERHYRSIKFCNLNYLLNMPIFQYKGYRTDGSEAAGTIEADSLKNAALRLKESGLYPKSVSEAAYKKRFGFSQRYEAALLPSITRQLSTMLSSGVTLMEALRSISEEQKGLWRNILVNIRENVSAGASFSKALEAYGSVFPEFYVNMVAAGEASGTLDAVLGRMADFLESQENLRSKVRTAMIYPTVYDLYRIHSPFFPFCLCHTEDNEDIQGHAERPAFYHRCAYNRQ